MEAMEQVRDEQAQTRIKPILGIMVALFVGVLLAAFLAPVAIDAMSGTSTDSFNNVSQGDSVEFANDWNATLDNVNSSSNEIDITVNHTTSGGGSQSITGLSENSSSSVNVDGENITVTNDKVESSTIADFSVEYSTDLGWGDNTQSLWAIVPLGIVLVLLLAFVRIAMAAQARV